MQSQSLPVDEVLRELDELRGRDPDVHGGRLFGLVYPSGRVDIEELIHAVYERYLFSNALNPLRFAAQAGMEREVIAMAGDLVHRRATEHHGGAMTSGGTESILMSMLVNRERARAKGIDRPQILAPWSAHPAYAKAAHYFDMEFVPIPLDGTYRADVAKARELMTDRTCVVVASAYSYPHGIMDPVEELAALAQEHGAACHVDACIGGFVLPFMEMLGRDVPLWDFRVEGVTEISMDVHKYGYVPKGASLILHRDDDWLWYQTFFYDQWGSGLYATPAIAGARAAAPIVAAWAVMKHLGVEGYKEIVSELLVTVAHVREGIAAITGIDVVGEPLGPLLALRSDTIDLYAVADVMDEKGWHLNRNTEPYGLHLMLSPAHCHVVDELLEDLNFAVSHHGNSQGKPARYA
ncbi:MAG: aminotransferase class V-fold PLP-dependent enzyme [Acidimicrobiales bacterium]